MKIGRIEALRGLAAAYVLFHHAVPHDAVMAGVSVGWLFRFGQEAVMLFFLVSGFVINYSFMLSADKRTRTFVLRRGARVYIPLVMVLAMHYLLRCAEVGYFFDPQLSALAMNLLMVQDVSSLKPGVLADPYLGNAPLWSLSYEWWFYMAYIFLVRRVECPHTRQRAVLFCGVIASVAYCVWPLFLIRLPMYLCLWWVGVEISNLYLRGGAVSVGALRPVLTALCVIVIVLGINAAMLSSAGTKLSLGLYPLVEVRHFCFALFAVFVGVVWRRLQWIGFRSTVGRFTLFAPISYALYICHFNILNSPFLLGLNLQQPWVTLLAMVIALACSYLIEAFAYPRMRRKLQSLLPSLRTDTGAA